MLKYYFSTLGLHRLDPVLIILITDMNSFSLNGHVHVQLSSRAGSGFLLHVLCIKGVN